MCHFITATAGGIRDDAKLRRLAEECGFNWKPIRNDSLTAILRPGEEYFSTNRGMICDCGTDIGSLARLAEPVRDNSEEQIRQLQKKGWSKAKIERWLQDKQNGRARSQERQRQVSANSDWASQHWSKFILASLDEGLATWIGLLLHWYRRGVEDENLQNLKPAWVSRSDLTPSFLLNVEEDVLYRFAIGPTHAP